MRPASLSLSLVFALASVGTACQALLVFGRDEGGRADDDAAASGIGDASPDGSALDAGSNADAQPPHRCGARADAGDYANAVLADLPLAYWRLDEPNGSSTVCDMMGTHAGALVVGQPTRGTPGALLNDSDPSTSFSGADSVVIPTEDLVFAGNAVMTIEAWVKPATQFKDFAHVFTDQKRGGQPRQGYALLLEHGQPKFERFVDEVPTYIRIDQPLDTNAWTYLAATFDGATGTLFINGVQAGTLSDIRAVPAHVTPAFIGAPSGELSSDPYGFIGAIDEVAVYDHVLTSDRLVAHFKASLPGPR